MKCYRQIHDVFLDLSTVIGDGVGPTPTIINLLCIRKKKSCLEKQEGQHRHLYGAIHPSPATVP